MNRCTNGHATSNRYGKSPRTWARCSSQRKNAAIARKTHTPIVEGAITENLSGLWSDAVLMETPFST
jgi:hypothetical protein